MPTEKLLTKESSKALLAMLKHSYFKNVRDDIKQIWARSRNSEDTANEWLLKYHPLIVECEKLAIEPKVCARMCYIKYHKENPYTKHLNKNNDVSLTTLKKEALQYFEGLKKWKEDNELLNELNKQVTASTGDNMKCNLDKNSINLLKSIGFEFRRSHDNDGETLDAYRTAKGKYEWIMCLGKKEATEGYQYRYFVYKNRNDMLLGRKAIKDVDFKNKKELLDYFKLKATASTESKVFAYKGQVITASSREEALLKVCASYAKVSKNYNKTYDFLVDEWNANNKTKGWYSNKSNYEGKLVKNALNRNEFDIAFSFVLMDYSSEDTCLLVVSKRHIPKNKCDKVLTIASKALECKGIKRGHNNFIKVIICSTRQCDEPFYYKTGPKKVPSREQEALERKERQQENKREYSRRYHQNNKPSKTDWDAIRRLGLAPSQPIVPDKL